MHPFQINLCEKRRHRPFFVLSTMSLSYVTFLFFLSSSFFSSTSVPPSLAPLQQRMSFFFNFYDSNGIATVISLIQCDRSIVPWVLLPWQKSVFSLFHTNQSSTFLSFLPPSSPSSLSFYVQTWTIIHLWPHHLLWHCTTKKSLGCVWRAELEVLVKQSTISKFNGFLP